MKKIRKILITVYILTGLAFLSGCEPIDDFDGIARDRYIGTWSCVDDNLKLSYQVEIEANPSNMAQVIIQNFGGIGFPAVALVSETTIYVEIQKVGTFWCEGEGIRTGNVINWHEYIIGEEEKTAVYTKR